MRDDRWRGPSSASHGVYKRPSGPNADGAATLRNVLPWRNMEKELAMRLAEKAAKGELSHSQSREVDALLARVERHANQEEPAPDSGVRASAPGTVAAAEESMRPLTYSMYTVSELDEARVPAKLSGPVTTAPVLGWSDVRRSAITVVRMLVAWVRAPKPRPQLKEHLSVPLATFGVDLRSALGRLPWKKIGWTTVGVVGAFALFLFAVMTVAELTDDLKPNRSGVAAASKYNLQGSSETTSAKLDVSPANAAPVASEQIELDDEAPAPVVKAKAAPAPKPKAKAKKPKPPDMFNP